MKIGFIGLGNMASAMKITDDCSAVEKIGVRIRMVEGDERNIKITTPMDLKIAEMLLEEMQ